MDRAKSILKSQNKMSYLRNREICNKDNGRHLNDTSFLLQMNHKIAIGKFSFLPNRHLIKMAIKQSNFSWCFYALWVFSLQKLMLVLTLLQEGLTLLVLSSNVSFKACDWSVNCHSKPWLVKPQKYFCPFLYFEVKCSKCWDLLEGKSWVNTSTLFVRFSHTDYIFGVLNLSQFPNNLCVP